MVSPNSLRVSREGAGLAVGLGTAIAVGLTLLVTHYLAKTNWGLSGGCAAGAAVVGGLAGYGIWRLQRPAVARRIPVPLEYTNSNASVASHESTDTVRDTDAANHQSTDTVINTDTSPRPHGSSFEHARYHVGRNYLIFDVGSGKSADKIQRICKTATTGPLPFRRADRGVFIIGHALPGWHHIQDDQGHQFPLQKIAEHLAADMGEQPWDVFVVACHAAASDLNGELSVQGQLLAAFTQLGKKVCIYATSNGVARTQSPDEMAVLTCLEEGQESEIIRVSNRDGLHHQRYRQKSQTDTDALQLFPRPAQSAARVDLT
jgi:hypothetical protein